MTDMAWLAAVLQPRDVCIHPNLGSKDDDGRGPSRLAGILLGGDWSRRDARAPEDPDVALDLEIIEAAIRMETIATAVPRLAARLEESPADDLARGTALALIVAALAPELDDYGTTFRTIERQLARIGQGRDSDTALLRAALLQQRALRERDAGVENGGTLRDVADSLARVLPESCSTFRTSLGVSWDSRQTIYDIRRSLIAAASRLLDFDDRSAPPSPLLGIFDLIKQPPTSMDVRAAFGEAHEYSRYIRQQFSHAFGSRSVVLGGPAPADLFHVQFGLELLGSVGVYESRKEVALLRLLQRESDVDEMAEALRLLRHAGAKQELDFVLRRLQAAGPLSALSKDARRILTTRLDRRLLRTLEVRVLGAASEVLAKSEARTAIDAVSGLLADGGPTSVAGYREIEISRREVAWLALAQLGPAARMTDRVASLLRGELERVADLDAEIVDRGMWPAVSALEWDDASPEERDAWRGVVRARGDVFPQTCGVVTAALGDVVTAPEEPAFAAVIAWTDGLLQGRAVGDLSETAIDLLRERLQVIRSDASRGKYSLGGGDVADVAAALLTKERAGVLWSDLTDFLLDTRVQVQERAHALDRLARSAVSIPEDVAERFRDAAIDLLERLPRSPMGPEVRPFPAALRFLAAFELLDESSVYEAITALAGSADEGARRQAAATVAVLAARRSRPELLVLALPLSHDRDVDVRGHAARALGFLSTQDGLLSSVARGRLVDLLGEDGLRVPLRVLGALEDSAAELPTEISRRARELAESHPSRSVRASAARLARRAKSGN